MHYRALCASHARRGSASWQDIARNAGRGRYVTELRTEQGDDIGTLQTSFVLKHHGDDFVFVLSGRKWETVEVNLEAGVVRARPAPAGKIPLWNSGQSGFLSRTIMEEQRLILTDSTEEDFLTPNAKHDLRALREEWRPIVMLRGWPVESGPRGATVYSFAGGRINMAVARAIAHRLPNAQVKESNESFTLTGDGVTAGAVVSELSRLALGGFDAELELAVTRAIPRSRVSKFQPLLPDALQGELLAQRVVDFRGAEQALRDRPFPIFER